MIPQPVQSWADMEDMDDDPLDEFGCGEEDRASDDFLPEVTCPPVRKQTIEPSGRSLATSANDLTILIEADLAWAKKTTIEVTHDVRVYNKETNELKVQQNVRQLNVVAKRDYDKRKELVDKTRTHRGPNRDVVDAEKQETKIKLANSLLKMCYKDPRQPCTFVYPVARIYVLDKDRQTRILTRNEVFRGASCYFEIGDQICDMTTLPQPVQSNK
jgi:hypothetical protein